jgi:RDD family
LLAIFWAWLHPEKTAPQPLAWNPPPAPQVSPPPAPVLQEPGEGASREEWAAYFAAEAALETDEDSDAFPGADATEESEDEADQGAPFGGITAWLWELAGLVVYYCLTEGLTGRSPAKWITGTIVVRADNFEHPGFGHMILRSLCRLIPFNHLSIFWGNGIMWHDSLSGTITADVSSAARMPSALASDPEPERPQRQRPSYGVGPDANPFLRGSTMASDPPPSAEPASPQPWTNPFQPQTAAQPSLFNARPAPALAPPAPLPAPAPAARNWWEPPPLPPE